MKIKRNKKKYLIIIICLLVLITISFFIFYRPKKEIKLELIQNKTGYYAKVDFDNIEAKVFKLYVRTLYRVIAYETEITKEVNKINLAFPTHGDIYTIQVIAYNENNEKIYSSLERDFVWDTPTFDRKVDYIIKKGKDNSLKIIGEVEKNYKVIYKHDKKTIAFSSIENNSIKYPNEIFDYDKQKITAYLMDGTNILDTKNIYINVEQIKTVRITSPIQYKEYVPGYMKVEFQGGENANFFELKIKHGDIVIDEKIITNRQKKEFIIDSDLLQEKSIYSFLLKARYDTYEELAKTSEVSIITRTKGYVYPVHTYNDVHVKNGGNIELGNVLKNVQIRFTLDGSEPSINHGHLYESSIGIFGDTQVKAIAFNEYGITSVVSTFNYKLERKQIKIYVSPSVQDYNHGHKNSPYTTEKRVMNKLADILIPKLEAAGFVTYRNSPKKEMIEWFNEGRRNKIDFHLALHSNGSRNHDLAGVKAYIDVQTSKTYSLATILQEELMKVYPYKLNTNNGVTYSYGALGETRDTAVAFGILLEIGYHDDYNDAVWIVNNLNEIADAITKALVRYYDY